MINERFDRNVRFFGKEGQERLCGMSILIAGVGGIGSHVVAQTALLGVGEISIVDRENLSLSNRNRYIGAWHKDKLGTPKVKLAKRHVKMIDPNIKINAINNDIISREGLEALKDADFVFGCVDKDGVRFFLNEACTAYNKPFIDLASDAPDSNRFGGHIIFVDGEHGCLHCMSEIDNKTGLISEKTEDILDATEVRHYLSSPQMLKNEQAIYNIDREALSEIGPSVVSVNGVVASLGVTLFMAKATGLELPNRFFNYLGHLGIVSRKKMGGFEGCYYCTGLRGQGDNANLDRYFNERTMRQVQTSYLAICDFLKRMGFSLSSILRFVK